MIALLEVPRSSGGMKPPVTKAVTLVPPCHGVIFEPRSGSVGGGCGSEGAQSQLPATTLTVVAGPDSSVVRTDYHERRVPAPLRDERLRHVSETIVHSLQHAREVAAHVTHLPGRRRLGGRAAVVGVVRCVLRLVLPALPARSLHPQPAESGLRQSSRAGLRRTGGASSAGSTGSAFALAQQQAAERKRAVKTCRSQGPWTFCQVRWMYSGDVGGRASILLIARAAYTFAE